MVGTEEVASDLPSPVSRSLVDRRMGSASLDASSSSSDEDSMTTRSRRGLSEGLFGGTTLCSPSVSSSLDPSEFVVLKLYSIPSAASWYVLETDIGDSALDLDRDICSSASTSPSSIKDLISSEPSSSSDDSSL